MVCQAVQLFEGAFVLVEVSEFVRYLSTALVIRNIDGRCEMDDDDDDCASVPADDQSLKKTFALMLMNFLSERNTTQIACEFQRFGCTVLGTKECPPLKKNSGTNG
jgi:hypothetical protein